MEQIAVQDPEDWEDFEAAANRPLEQHIRNSFIHTYKPVLGDAEYRSFDTMAEYWKRYVEPHGFPVAHIDDIVASKEAANRRKDKESLPRLLSFRAWLKKEGKL